MSDVSEPPSATVEKSGLFSDLLRRLSLEQADNVFAQFSDKPSWTYAQIIQIARNAVDTLAAAGVGRGDVVLCWLRVGPELIRMWIGIKLLSAPISSRWTFPSGASGLSVQSVRPVPD
jgi:acyl-CoA synthetase (AMP-forming)/AMP-acid ligase II